MHHMRTLFAVLGSMTLGAATRPAEESSQACEFWTADRIHNIHIALTAQQWQMTEIMRQLWPPQLKNSFWTSLPGKNPPKFLFLKPNPFSNGILPKTSLKSKLFQVLNMPHPQTLSTLVKELKDPRPASHGNGELRVKCRALSSSYFWIAKFHVTCHLRQLSPFPETCQLSSPYLAWASVGRKIPDAGDRGTPSYRREWQENFSPEGRISSG
jgi:hypothetical protein